MYFVVIAPEYVTCTVAFTKNREVKIPFGDIAQPACELSFGFRADHAFMFHCYELLPIFTYRNLVPHRVTTEAAANLSAKRG